MRVARSAIVEITLDRQGAEHLAAFEARAVADEAVRQCYRVSPGPDFLLILQVSDMPGYHALVQRLFTQDANVRNVKAFFSVSRAVAALFARSAAVSAMAAIALRFAATSRSTASPSTRASSRPR